MFKIDVKYPSLEEEVRIISEFHGRIGGNDPDVVQPVMTPQAIAAYRASVRSVRCEDPLVRYIAQVVEATRNNSALYLGASPRASLAILMGAKAFAAMSGRDFVIPEDIRRTLVPVLQHRILLTPEREMEGMGPADVINDIIAKIEVPR